MRFARTLGLLCAATTLPFSPALSKDKGAAWPTIQSSFPTDPATEQKIDAMIAGMSVEDKVAQVVQPDIASVTPADVAKYHFGSILNGGNSAPKGNEMGPPADWLKLADQFWEASVQPRADGKAPIPIIWGTDAVHGHTNIVGATLFPHNIGLGAAHDPELIRHIGEVTAKEMAITGIDWNFSPTIAVARDERWGRAYESFSENPELVASYAAPMVEGLQGIPGQPGFLGAGKVIATVKHFLGDGGTTGGKDQGDTVATEKELRDIYAPPYFKAIEAGVQAVMASFSSVNGEKVHGDKHLLTEVLKDDLGFKGLVVGDWNAHGQVPGCSNEDCPASINAGLDMYMAPDGWRGLYDNLVREVKAGQVPMARLDDAVRRILRVKFNYDIFDKGKPSSRPFAGQFNLLGAPEHRAVARRAVRESLVLLKNDARLLPLARQQNVLVAGDGADNMSKQTGGWSLTWQGTGVTQANYPNSETIYQGIAKAVVDGGGAATLSVDGSYTIKPDVAIVVFGEDAYAEFMGDRATTEYSPGNKHDLELLKKLKSDGIPVVAVFLSGRPMWVNPEINASDAFVAAFLPGTEGGGVADVLFRKLDGSINYDFTGKLSFSWPKRIGQEPINIGDKKYDPLFAYGYGLNYASDHKVGTLSEERPKGAGVDAQGLVFGRGRVPEGWRIGLVEQGQQAVPLNGNSGQTGQLWLKAEGIDRNAQEDARRFTWSGQGVAAAEVQAASPLDLTREANGELSLIVDYRVDQAPGAGVPVTLGQGCGQNCGGTVPVAGLLRQAPAGQWTSMAIPLQCLAKADAKMDNITTPFSLQSKGPMTVSISGIRIASANGADQGCGME